MRKTNLILVFAFVLLVDGLVLPSLFGFREGVLTLAFLLAMLLNWGPVPAVLWLGSGMALFLEVFWKVRPGSILLLFLGASFLYHFVFSSFSVKRYIGAAVLSFGAIPAFWHNGLAVAVTAFVGFAASFLLFDKLQLVARGERKFTYDSPERTNRM